MRRCPSRHCQQLCTHHCHAHTHSLSTLCTQRAALSTQFEALSQQAAAHGIALEPLAPGAAAAAAGAAGGVDLAGDSSSDDVRRSLEELLAPGDESAGGKGAESALREDDSALHWVDERGRWGEEAEEAAGAALAPALSAEEQVRRGWSGALPAFLPACLFCICRFPLKPTVTAVAWN